MSSFVCSYVKTKQELDKLKDQEKNITAHPEGNMNNSIKFQMNIC